MNLVIFSHDSNTRAEKVRALRWQLGAVLPENVAEKLSAAERDCFKAYDKLLGEYMGTGPDGIGIDLTVVSGRSRAGWFRWILLSWG